MCTANHLSMKQVRGFEPALWSRAFLRLLCTGSVPRDFEFRFTKSTRIGYTGMAAKAAAEIRG
jgi:hypothetical protein